MRSVFIYSLFLLFVVGLARQNKSQTNPKIDSLRKVLIGTKDSTQAHVLLKLAAAYKNINLNQSIKYGTEALQIAEKLNNINLIYSAVYKLSFYYKGIGELNTALNYLFKCEKIALQLKDVKGLAQTYNSFGNIYIELSNHTKALFYLQKSLQLKESVKDTPSVIPPVQS